MSTLIFRQVFTHEIVTGKLYLKWFQKEYELVKKYFSKCSCYCNEIKPFDSLPGPKGLPLVGNALQYSKFGRYSFERILESKDIYLKKYGPIYREKMGPYWIVHLFNPEDVATMFKNEGTQPSRGSYILMEGVYSKSRNLPPSPASRDGKDWYNYRMALQQFMMSLTAATKYTYLQAPVAEDFVKLIATESDGDGVVSNLYDTLFSYAAESIGVVCFGQRLGCMDKDNVLMNRFVKALTDMFTAIQKTLLSVPWYILFETKEYRDFARASDEIIRVISEITDKSKVFKLKNGISDSSTSKYKDQESRCLMEVLKSSNLSDTEIKVMVEGLFTAGVDSTAKGMYFLLYNLANNPDKQEKLFLEICSLIKEHKNGDVMQPDIIKNSVYLKACLRESFRLYFPTFVGTTRILSKDVIMSNYHIPKNTRIMANMATMCKMNEYFSNPESFIPERWIRGHTEDIREQFDKISFTNLPFGHGVRNCIGKRFAEQEIYLAVLRLIKEYRLENTGPKSLDVYTHIFTAPVKPAVLRLIRRNTNQQI